MAAAFAVTLTAVSAEPADSLPADRGVNLNDVVVYGNRGDFGVRSSQMSAVTVNPAQIMVTPMFFGDPDVLKTLQKLPGVQSGAEGSAGIFVRGGDYDQNYITLDGSVIYNAEHLKGYVSAINPDMTRSVSFYRGAFPARFGGRLSSVVDVGLRDGDFNRYHGLLSLGMLTGRAQVEGPILKGRTSFNAAARMSYFGLIAKPILKEFYDRPGALRPYDDMSYYDVTAKVVHKFGERSRLSAVLYYGKDSDNAAPAESIQTEDRTEDPYVAPEYQTKVENRRSNEDRSEWTNLLGSLYYTAFVRENHRLNANLSYTRYVHDQSSVSVIDDKTTKQDKATTFLYYSLDEEYRMTMHSGVEDLSLTVDGDWTVHPSHRLRYGAKASRQWLNPYTEAYKDMRRRRFRGGLTYDEDAAREEAEAKGEEYVSPGYDEASEHLDYRRGETLTVDNVSVYAEDDYSVTRDLRLSLGLRFGAYMVSGKTYLSLEPRVSARYMIGENLSVKASYTRMSQAIHRLMTNNLVTPGDMWVPITDELPLMKSDQWAAGVSFDWRGFSLSGEAYYKTLDNVLEYRNGATYFVEGRDWREIVASGEGRSYGFELLLERRIGRTTGWVSYTWSKALRKFDRPGEQINSGREFYSSADRRNNISVNVTHRFRLRDWADLDLTASWTYQTGRRGNVPTVITFGQSLQEYLSSVPMKDYEKVLYESDFAHIPIGSDIYSVKLTDIYYSKAYQTYRGTNDFKMPDSHHLDINMNLTVRYGIWESIFGLGIYNIYNHYNVSSVYVGYKDGKAVLKGVCPFPFMPSISFTQKF